MKKFKLVFYPIYVLAALLIIYFSIDIMSNKEAYLAKMPIDKNYNTFANYALAIFLVASLLMLIEIVIENIQLIKLRKMYKKEKEAHLNLKAQLYDESRTARPIDTTPVIMDATTIESTEAKEENEWEDDEDTWK